MAKFCKRCGARLNELNGLCPNCDKTEVVGKAEEISSVSDNVPEQQKQLSKEEIKAEKKQLKKQAKKDKKKQKRAQLTTKQKVKRFFVKLIAVVLALAIAAGGCVCALVYFDIINVPIINKTLSLFGVNKEKLSEESYEVTPPDADEYFSDNSIIKSQTDANTSTNVLTEGEVSEFFASRGFEQTSIITEYSMDGEYLNSTSISDSSATKHPMYQTQYVTTQNELWTLFVIDGNIMANPVSYNTQSTSGVKVVFSESETITSYDSTTNKFYETIPNKNALFVIVTDRIDSDALEKLTIGEIDNYVQ